ncbi:MAG: hypothetical protein E7L00_02725 [Propionibacteriaceae bacterium]|nr:hypothetical protein [Propionibacteriaceae bacterium]
MATPVDAAPQTVQRTRLVAEAMESLEGTEDRSVDEQLALLSEAQELLSGVLHNADAAQLRIPGLR